MNKMLFSFLMIWLFAGQSFAQNNTIFDDSRLSSIHITIPPDSLAVLYDSILSEHYYITRFIFDDGSTRDTLENVGFRLRGNTSRYSQKKSFKISFNEYVSGRKYQGVKKLNLNGEHNDPTMIREKLFYELWKKSGMVERRTSFVRVYINNQYYGLYTNLEEMDKDWLDRVYPDKSGNLYKCTYPADLVYHGPFQLTYKNLENGTATGGRVYDLQTNETEDDYSRLVNLITVLNESPNSQFTAHIEKILNVDHFLKALAIDVATGNWDDYGYNKNNYYLYDNPEDLLFDFITYDADNTFGVDWMGVDWATRDCRNWVNKSMQLPLAQKLMAVPSYFDKYKLFLDTIVNNITHPDSVFPRIDAIKLMIRQAAAEDVYRTLDYGYSMADFDNAFVMKIDQHTPYGLKPFFTKRREYILKQLHPYGLESLAGQFNVRIYPNPASSVLYVGVPHQQKEVASLTILNLPGEEMSFRQTINQDVTIVDIENFPSGMYVLIVESKEGIRIAKTFIKQ